MINENLENEIWKDIPGYEGRFQISNMGRVKRIIIPGKKETIPNLCTERAGYKKVSLSKKDANGIITQKTFLVHRLVGMAFVPGYVSGLEINHKDGNKQNNRAENLEWVTRSRNMKHAFENGLTKKNTGPNSYLFCQFDKDGKLIRKWKSVQDCAYFLSVQGFGDEHTIASNIWACLNNRFKSCCGFLFSFEDHIDAESKLAKNCVSVIATLVVGRRGHKVLSDKPEDTIRFRYVNETEGYVMPNGQTAYATLVSKCCKGKRDTHAGYKWRYEESDFHIKEQKPIYQYDLNWNLVKVWTCGVMEIAKQLGLATNSGISTCLNSDNKNKTCAGYHWRYENEQQ